MKDREAHRKGFKEGLQISNARLVDAGRHTLGFISVMQLNETDREKFNQVMKSLSEIQESLPRYIKSTGSSSCP